PAGGIIAYAINHAPQAHRDRASVRRGATTVIDALANDADPDGDRLAFSRVAGRSIDMTDGAPDEITTFFGTIRVFNPGDDPADPQAAYLEYTPSRWHPRHWFVVYSVEDLAPNRVVNGVETSEPNPTHVPREDATWVEVTLER
ncbi:MAG TPA: Ig-like domain-containing protein, partial [Phycisphaerae bacterium]|nr:Ig-like domain-containing protein [Phycisphaerae bacterium]